MPIMSLEKSIGEWAAYQWAVVGRLQRHIAEELNASPAQVCVVIAEFVGPEGFYNWDRKGILQRMFHNRPPPTKPYPLHIGSWRGPTNAPLDIASVRWSISAQLRQHLIYLDRQDRTPLKTIGECWKIS